MGKNAVETIGQPDSSSTPRLGLTAAAGSTNQTSRPSTAPLPALLASALNSGTVARFDEHGFAGYAEDATWQPPQIGSAEQEALNLLLACFRDEVLAPGGPLLIAGRLRALLAHWIDRRELDDPTLEAVNADWLRVMSRYPLWAVHQAAAEWLEMNRHRPTIADIRLLCDQAVRADRLALRLMEKLAAAQEQPARALGTRASG